MNTRLFSLMLLALISVYVVGAANQSDREFVDQAGKYRITLVGDWRPVTYTDAMGRTKTEFVCRERSEGLLRVNKESLNRRSPADIARKAMEELKLCQPAVMVGGDEEFVGGALPGRRVAFCYIEGNSWVAATYYFLEDRDAVWILRFTGRMGVLNASHDIMDRMARSFYPM
jgi:hypothetical protein